jgi:tetratricopeptide (TPR) repeat protein
MRSAGVAVFFLILCGEAVPAEPTKPAEPTESAVHLWEKGQAAMREGRADQALECFQQSLARDPTLACNHLSLAAAFLDKGDDAGAAPHFAAYLALQPAHHLVRAHYAELLLRLRDTAAARAQFERFEVAAADGDEAYRRQLIHCHSRLMEIAEGGEDAYAAHLHHGIGLYLLACQRAQLPDGDGDEETSTESLLCKAAGELAQAWRRQPEEARPCWYLFSVWTRLAQRQPAMRWLRAAEAAAPFGDLTPAERRELRLACQGRDAEARRK